MIISNPLFRPETRFGAQIDRAAFSLSNTERGVIVLAVVEDAYATASSPLLLRQEAMGALAEAMFGDYHFYEINAVTMQGNSLPRHCLNLPDRPACVFAYGLETLKTDNAERYDAVVTLLNNHRENIRDTSTAFVLWLTPSTLQDVLRQAPDFADWRLTMITFRAEAGQNVPQTALGNLLPSEADKARRDIARFQEMVQRPSIAPYLAVDFYHNLAYNYHKLGTYPRTLRPSQSTRHYSDRSFRHSASGSSLCFTNSRTPI